MSQLTVTEYSLKTLCAGQGSLDYNAIQEKIATHFSVSGTELNRVLYNTEHFAVVKLSGTEALGSNLTPNSLVIAITSVRLCRNYSKRDCENCGKLHLCRRFIYDDCRSSKAKKPCTYSHDIQSPHNAAILSANGLHNLDIKELRQLLLQNDPTLLPEVCTFYNKGNGPFGSCSFKQSCNKLHMCLQFILGACPHGNQCERRHSFLESRELLEKRRVNIELICDLPTVYRNICAIRRWESADEKEKGPQPSHAPSNPASDMESEEICLFFLRKHCSFKDRCKLVHFKLPYRWQVYEEMWKDLPNMEQIEKDYCDPNNIGRAGPPPVNFMTMTSNLSKVRRLSTVSSVTKPQHYSLTTEWLWYWQANTGEWIEYGKPEDSDIVSVVTSTDLENLYLADSKEKMVFQTTKHRYIVDFEAMLQKNLILGTCREIRRRPRFISEQEMERQIYSKGQGKDSPAPVKTVPTHWEMSAQPNAGYKLISVSESSDEYKQVQSLFQRTMRNSVIRKIERIQNLALWEVFQWQKEQMKKKNGGKEVLEKQLFYGWDSSPVAIICQGNIDWRICGTHGEGYGKGEDQIRLCCDGPYRHNLMSRLTHEKWPVPRGTGGMLVPSKLHPSTLPHLQEAKVGSYFATDASYADNFTPTTSATKTMFLARVLVGQFFKGRENYCRPPSKDGSYTNLYDSCTDNDSVPSIFIIFEKHQIYPEYIIEYNNKVGFMKWMMEIFSGRSASAK